MRLRRFRPVPTQARAPSSTRPVIRADSFGTKPRLSRNARTCGMYFSTGSAFCLPLHWRSSLPSTFTSKVTCAFASQIRPKSAFIYNILDKQKRRSYGRVDD
jgi:hypothetical protein